MKNNSKQVIRAEGSQSEAVARRHNELVTAKFRLSLQAHRLFLYVLAQVREEHNEDAEYHFTVYELAKAIGVDRNHLYGSIIAVLDELAACIVDVVALDGDGKPRTDGFVRVGLVKNKQFIRVAEDGQKKLADGVSVGLYKELLPYVRALKGRYTDTELKYVFRLTSSYSQKIYDLLKSQAFTGRPWKVPRTELFKLLAIEVGKFSQFGDFRRYVLELAQREINTHTDLAFDLEYVSSGRTVTFVIFHLRKEGGSQIELLPGTQKHTVFKAMCELGLQGREAEKLLAQWWDVDTDRVRWHVEEVKRLQRLGKLRSKPVAWLRAGLRKDYRPKANVFRPYKTLGGDGAVAIDDPELQKALHNVYGHFRQHEDGAGKAA